jgi:hypothetical protein
MISAILLIIAGPGGLYGLEDFVDAVKVIEGRVIFEGQKRYVLKVNLNSDLVTEIAGCRFKSLFVHFGFAVGQTAKKDHSGLEIVAHTYLGDSNALDPRVLDLEAQHIGNDFPDKFADSILSKPAHGNSRSPF